MARYQEVIYNSQIDTSFSVRVEKIKREKEEGEGDK
jgi:hypothetical protein